MKNKLLILSVASVIAVSGCVSTPLDYNSGTQISNEQLLSFKTEKASQSDVIQQLGHPDRREQLTDKELWYYDFTKIGMLSGNTSESTVFEWDNQGTLIDSYKTGNSGKTGNPLLDATK